MAINWPSAILSRPISPKIMRMVEVISQRRSGPLGLGKLYCCFTLVCQRDHDLHNTRSGYRGPILIDPINGSSREGAKAKAVRRRIV